MSNLYRKKPVVIEAVQFGGSYDEGELPEWWHVACARGRNVGGLSFSRATGKLLVFTLEGPLHAEHGDWIIRGVKGELYPCKPDVFATTYEAAGADEVAGQVFSLHSEKEQSHLPEREDGEVVPSMCRAAVHAARLIGDREWEDFTTETAEKILKAALKSKPPGG